MSNAQFDTAVAVPRVLVIISRVLVVMAWLQQDKRPARLGTMLDRLDTKIDVQVSGVRSEMIVLRDSIHRDMVPMYERMAGTEGQQR